MKKAFAALVLASALLVSCGSTLETSSSLTGSSSAASTAERAPIEQVLGLFDHSGTNNVTFTSIASSMDETSSLPSYKNPSMLVTYDETGFLVAPDLTTGWGETMTGSYGLVQLGDDNLAGKEAGVYPTVVSTVDVPSEDGTSSTKEEVLTLGAKSEFSSPYDLWTPQYMADHASELASTFGRGVSSNISTSRDEDTIMTLARCLSIEEVARKAFPNLAYTRVDVTYTRSSVSYVFDIIGYPNGRPTASTSLGDGFTIARAILYPRDIKIEAYASLFPSDENSSSSSNSEVGA